MWGQDGHSVPCPYWYFILVGQKVPVRPQKDKTPFEAFWFAA
jgi:hypothetical protein